jgi:hypothetical protein
MLSLGWVILGFAGFALLVLPGGAWKALWELLQNVREVHFPPKRKM